MTTNPFPAIHATLEQHGWGKGQAVSYDGALCLGAAINSTPLSGGQSRISVAQVLERGIASAGFPRLSNDWYGIPDFNDAPERTWEDIVLVLKHAERLWDERYGNPTPAGG